MRKRVVVTGLGCICPVGNNVQESWENIKAGRSGVGPITLFDPADHATRFAAEVRGFDPVAEFGSKEARRMDRYTQFAAAATREALADAGLDLTGGNRDRVGAFIGSGIGGVGTLLREYDVFRERGARRVSPFLVPMMLPDSASGQIAILFGLRGPNLSVVSACATGTNAIGEAAEVIRRGAADVMVAGGAESAILPLVMAAFNVMGALSQHNEDPQGASRPFDLNRDGFVAGEGAGALILEEYRHAQSRGARILAEVLGYGITNDAYHVSAPAENGAGAAECMKMALADAGLRPAEVDYLNAHGTSTPLNDKSETAAVKTVFGERAYDTPISSTKSMTGHLLGAAGAIEAAFCIKVMQEGLLPPTINYHTPDPACDLDYVPNVARPAAVRRVMSNSFGFGGHNATLILGAVNAD
ncbi:MAG: beta-ketoacyl-ACP synthase II [Chloroflexi bacterium]|nr:beta-ketoacyl-ACP synthase II [Chloroflexota bacterium]